VGWLRCVRLMQGEGEDVPVVVIVVGEIWREWEGERGSSSMMRGCMRGKNEYEDAGGQIFRRLQLRMAFAQYKQRS
jgi:hypothetical protein